MSLSLLLPLGLSALLALAIPLLLHLHRRQEQRRTVFAALRFIRAPARPRRRLRLEQWPLLLLRLLLLAVLAVLLAEPVSRGSLDTRDWVVVAPGVDAAQARALLHAPDAQWHWLLPGFPRLPAQSPGAEEAGSVASLLRELDGELAPQTRLHVIVPSVLYGLDGDIIRLSRDVDWHIVNSAPRVPARPAANAPQRLSLRQREPAAAARYLQAAATAWNRGETPRYRLFEETPEAALDASTAVVFWLAGEASPELLRWVEAGGTALLDSGGLADAEIVARDARGDALLFAQQRGRGRLLSFAAPLKPAALPLLLDSTFAEVLRSTLQPPAAPPDRGVAASLRPAVGAERGDPAARPLGDWLVLAAALLALAERALALAAARRRT